MSPHAPFLLMQGMITTKSPANQKTDDNRQSHRFIFDVSALYEAIGGERAGQACVFTTLVLCDALAQLGFPARPVAAAVEGRRGRVRFGIGHPGYQLRRPNAWKGHLVCMIGDLLIDPTIGQVARHGVDAPPLITVRSQRPLVPDARIALPDGWTLSWQAEGANNGWRTLRDADPAVREPAVWRLVQRLRPTAPATGGPLSTLTGPPPSAGP